VVLDRRLFELSILSPKVEELTKYKFRLGELNLIRGAANIKKEQVDVAGFRNAQSRVIAIQ
jgi:hypothetical protein